MKRLATASLLTGLTLMGCISCSGGVDPDGEPVAGKPESAESGEGQPTESDPDAQEGVAANGTENGHQPKVDINRMRLPEMETLPSESELTSNKPKPEGSGGVIARPPSE